MRELLMNGFTIYPQNGKFVVKKGAVPDNPQVIPESEYATYDGAIEAALAMLATVARDWSVIVRYNRGLGVEYKNFPDVSASTPEDAKSLAEAAVGSLSADPKVTISEIRVRPKN